MKNNKLAGDINNMAQLRWACRRGMLELDVLLGKFLDKKYASLPDAQKVTFIELLGHPDPQLFAWLLGQEVATDEKLATMIEAIRQHAKS